MKNRFSILICFLAVGVAGALGTTAGCGGPSIPAASSSTTAPSSLSYSTNPAVYTKSVAIAANSPSSSGGTVASYSVSQALPTGLSLNLSTGVISGTPTAITALASYTVTATNTGGSTSQVLSITVNDLAPTNLSYSTVTAVYANGTAIASNIPSSSGGAVVSYSIRPILPPGLTLNSTTGVISGTPTISITPGSFTVTASNTGGSATKVLSITINNVAPSSLTYSTNPAYYPVNFAITQNKPSSSGSPVVSYSVSPTLPTGLALNSSSGVISGTPTASTASSNYTITATNTAGSTTVALNLGVYGTASGLGFSVSPAGRSYVSNTTFSPVVVVAVQDANSTLVTSSTASITLALASGSGTLSGTLTHTAVNGLAVFNNLKINLAATYSLSASSSGLTATTSGTFTITAAAPSQFSITGTNTFIGGTCTGPFQIALDDPSGNAATNSSGSAWSFPLSSNGTLQFYSSSDSSCSSAPVTQASVASGQSSGTFYVKSSVPGSFSITANGTSVGVGTQTYSVSVNCLRTITTSYSSTPSISSPLTISYSMVGGGGGSGYNGNLNWIPGNDGGIRNGTFTLSPGSTLAAYVGGGGGGGAYTNPSGTGESGGGGGGAGYGGGSGGGYATTSTDWAGAGGGGGSSAVVVNGSAVDIAPGGSGGNLPNWGANGGSGGTSGSSNGGSGNGPFGGGGGNGSNGGSSGNCGTAGGSNGGDASSTSATICNPGGNPPTDAGGGGGGGYGSGGGGGRESWNGGLGANTWANSTTLPNNAGVGSTENGGNAGLVILTYAGTSCAL